MKLLSCLLLGGTVSIQGQTCPETHCANEVVNTAAVVASGSCPNLSAVTLATFKHNSDVLIELKGPSNLADAADLVITAPHGGDLKPNYIADRSTNDATYCPDGCRVDKDSYTKEIAQLLQGKFIQNYCKVPFLVINHLHRSKLDANREVVEAAQGDAIAGDAWFQFHNLTNYAQLKLRERFGTSTYNGVTGVKSLLFDMHGYAGTDWADPDGGPLIQWGYRLSDDPSLNPTQYCPLDDRSSGSIGSLTHARWIPGHSYECLVRGPGSLATRVQALVEQYQGGFTNNALCGHGIPSFELPSPWHVANDPAYCEDMNGPNPDACHYYSGDFDLEVHERMDWENIAGDHFNTVQAELPRCIRFGGNTVRTAFADMLSKAVMSFLRDLYGAMP